MTAPFDVLGAQIGQVGVVVDDLEEAVHAHADLGPWALYRYDRRILDYLRVGDEPADFAFRLALNRSQPQLEFIEPLDDRSPYARWMAASPGTKLHHLGFIVEDIEWVTAAMNAAGFPVILAGGGHGADGTGAFCYYDTAAALGYIAEAIVRPTQRREPEAVRG